MTATLKSYLIAGVLVLVVITFFAWRQHERQIGALNLLLHQQDSVHAVALKASQDSLAIFQRAAKEADILRARARFEVAKDAQIQAHTDSVVRASSQERAAATRMVADSGATRDSLRGELVRLASSSRHDSVVYAAERTQAQATIRALLLTVQADSTAIQKGTQAVNAMLARAVASEREVSLLKQSRPSTVGTLAKAGLYLAVGYGLAKVIR